jgi:purine-binding chemotaxis protein CheW
MTETENITAEKDELLQLVSFNLGKEEFGIDILKVQEIIRMIQITVVPNSKSFISGVINLRGRIIPVMDLRARLAMQPKDSDNNTRIIVVSLLENTIGFIVDSVSEVLRIPASVTEAPPSIVAGIRSDYITSVAKLADRILILLDLEKVITEDEIALQ